MKLAICTLMLVPAVATAQEPPQQSAPPGGESGRLDDTQTHDSTARKVGRAVFAVPRLVLHGLLAPVRLSLWAEERYHLRAHAHQLFYSESDALSVLPVLTYESAVGLRVGGQLDWRVPNDDHLRLFAGSGLGVGLNAGFKLSAGYTTAERGPFTAHTGIVFERRANDTFYGIGNNDEVDPGPMPLDADETAVETKYKHQLARATGSVDTRIVGDLHAEVSADVADRRRDPGTTGPPIDMVYDPISLVGFNHYQSAYGELDVRWDSRRTASRLDVNKMISGGSLVSVWGGPAMVTEGENFLRYGTDLQHYFRISNGPRLLSARFHGEAVTAHREGVPFNELPTLGGPLLLRGYPLERFRDVISGVATLEYQWDLSRMLYASVFADSGRVFSAYQNVTLSGLRTGYGVSLELHTPVTSIVRFSVASSVDGGVFFDLYFHPVFAVTPRVERR